MSQTDTPVLMMLSSSFSNDNDARLASSIEALIGTDSDAMSGSDEDVPSVLSLGNRAQHSEFRRRSVGRGHVTHSVPLNATVDHTSSPRGDHLISPVRTENSGDHNFTPTRFCPTQQQGPAVEVNHLTSGQPTENNTAIHPFARLSHRPHEERSSQAAAPLSTIDLTATQQVCYGREASYAGSGSRIRQPVSGFFSGIHATASHKIESQSLSTGEGNTPWASSSASLPTAFPSTSPIEPNASHQLQDCDASEGACLADHQPRSEMIYVNAVHSPRWSLQDPSTKMEVPTLLPNIGSEAKDHEEDSRSVGSINSSAVSSPPMLPQASGTGDMESESGNERILHSSAGTPSTVSTAPSTDDASAEGTDSLGWERLSLRLDETFASSLLYPRHADIRAIVSRHNVPNTGRMPSQDNAPLSGQEPRHQRSQSWEEPFHDSIGQFSLPMVHPLPDNQSMQGWGGSALNPSSGLGLPRGPHLNHVNAWSGARHSQARVATFRTDDAWGQSHRSAESPQHMQPPPHQLRVDPRGGPAYRHANFATFQGPQHKIGFAHSPPTSSMTPPRSPHSRQSSQARHPGTSSSTSGGGGPGQSNPSPQRSSAEVLKTLLRKKACLYEPDTSRAVALVTWLVGRELALAHGYFSRQQLQSGVHSCVSKKIESGTITRTKVNRCMQIILNSCFHYIIPRPDGTEENGDAFRRVFAGNAIDDSDLLRSLPVPWDDLVADRDLILEASAWGDDDQGKGQSKSVSESPSSSPRVGSSFNKDSEADGDSKRAVLLCFNENVRSAEDVFRCHNEFIRDTAHASNLQLSLQEWRVFFGKDATSTPLLWGSVGITTAGVQNESRKPDSPGHMSSTELSKFRTSWCAKRYDHDHNLCSFAHVEVNRGWLRRNPSEHSYREEMCSSVTMTADHWVPASKFLINACGDGTGCGFAHSKEEILYHPRVYKVQECSNQSSRGSGCALGDVCPHVHSSEYMRRRASNEGRTQASSHRHANFRPSQSHGYGGSAANKNVYSAPPEGAPMLYVRPAPTSSFEEQLAMPGLQNLFRRHCAVIASNLRTSNRSKCYYTNFGDDWGVSSETDQATSARPLDALPKET